MKIFIQNFLIKMLKICGYDVEAKIEQLQSEVVELMIKIDDMIHFPQVEENEEDEKELLLYELTTYIEYLEEKIRKTDNGAIVDVIFNNLSNFNNTSNFKVIGARKVGESEHMWKPYSLPIFEVLYFENGNFKKMSIVGNLDIHNLGSFNSVQELEEYKVENLDFLTYG